MKKVLPTLLIIIVFFLSSYPIRSYSACILGVGASDPCTLDNPLGPNNTNLYCFLKSVLSAFLNLLIVLAIFYLIYSGFQMVSARGNETKLKEAKQSFTYAVIGTAVLLGAWTLATIIQATVQNVTGGTIGTTTCP